MGTGQQTTIKRAWIAWAIITALMLAYCGAARIESHATVAQITLTPGEVVNLQILRVLPDDLRFELWFKAKGCEQRPELGRLWGSGKHPEPGTEAHIPGAEVRLLASTPHSAPVTFDAMPLSGYCSDINFRTMTANLPIEPGVYRWPEPKDTAAVRLSPGMNELKLQVETVAEPLLGEVVRVHIKAPLSFLNLYLRDLWLWPALWLWPVLVIVSVLWFVWLAWSTHRQLRLPKPSAPT